MHDNFNDYNERGSSNFLRTLHHCYVCTFKYLRFSVPKIDLEKEKLPWNLSVGLSLLVYVSQEQ